MQAYSNIGDYKRFRFSLADLRDFLAVVLNEPVGANLPYIVMRVLEKRGIPASDKREYRRLYYRLYRLARALAKKGFVVLDRSQGLLLIKPTIDLITRFCASKTSRKSPEEGGYVEFDIRLPREARRIRHLLFKPPLEWSDEEFEELNLCFLDYIEDRSERIIVLRSLKENEFGEREYLFLRYRTRFTDPSYIRRARARYNEAWDRASSQFTFGVFVTITLPPVFPLAIQRYALSYMINCFKAWLRRRYGYCPHIRVNEFQHSGNLHVHLVVFGVSFIEEKREFTRLLDGWLEAFLGVMGSKINGMRRKKLSEWLVARLDRIGRALLRRYKRYKRRHGGLEGPINYLCAIRRTRSGWDWAGKPPTYVLEASAKIATGKLADGGSISPRDYLSKYLGKALNAVSALTNGNSSPFDEPEGNLLACYWLTSTRFFSYSYSLVSSRPPPSSGGYEFVGSWREEDMPDPIFEHYLEWRRAWCNI